MPISVKGGSTQVGIKLVSADNYTVPDGYGVYSPDQYEVSNGNFLEVGSGSIFEIG